MGPHRNNLGGNGSEMSLVMGTGDDPSLRRIEASQLSSASSGSYQWENFAKAVRGEDIGPISTPETIVAGLCVIEAMARAEQGNGVADI